jgi:hypothetical protein
MLQAFQAVECRDGRRIPPLPRTWRVDKTPHGYVIRDANGHALAYLYSRENDAEARQARVLRLSCAGANLLDSPVRGLLPRSLALPVDVRAQMRVDPVECVATCKNRCLASSRFEHAEAGQGT